METQSVRSESTEGRSRFVPLATGLSYHVVEWGPPDAPPLVFCHGFLDIAWSWDFLAREGLAERYRMIAPDFRGHGESDRVGAGGYYHFPDYVADLTSLVDGLGLDSFGLVGHSMGGSVVSYFTGAFPDRVNHLALLEGLGPPEGDDALPDRIPHWLRGWKRGLAHKRRPYDSLAEAADRLKKTDPFVDDDTALWLAERATERVDGRYCFRHDPVHLSMGPTPYRVDIASQFWRRINCPVLLVEGSESSFRLAPEIFDERKAYFPHAEQAVIEGAAHMMMRHQPAALARVLDEFFGS